jgi:hypothetical protein
VSRLAAQLAHIDQTMEILQSFIQEKQIKNPGDNVSFERYSQLKQFVRTHCDSPDHVVYINGKCHTVIH